MTAVARRRIGPTACVVLLLSQGPQSAQDLTSVYAPLALSTEPAAVEPLRWCGTPGDRLRRAGVVTAGPLDDGHLLRADQFPRHLSATHTGDFGFSNLLVLGDHETLTFERVDPDADSKRVAETWTRTGTNVVAGRMVSVFNPTWSVEVAASYGAIPGVSITRSSSSATWWRPALPLPLPRRRARGHPATGSSSIFK